jgi:serralysin
MRSSLTRRFHRRAFLASPVVLAAPAWGAASRSLEFPVSSSTVKGPTGMSGRWSKVLEDEFDGPQLNADLWNTCYPWGEDNNGDGSDNCYLAENVALNGDGHLILTGRQGTVRGVGSTGDAKTWPYNSGQINTFGKFSMQHGAVEIRARVPRGAGAWPAFWALPANGSWPPEVDVMEIYGNEPSVLEMTYHIGTAATHRSHSSRTVLPSPSTFNEDFHVYGCSISPIAITWYLDGVEQWSFTNEKDVSQLKPLYLVCNLAIGGLSGNPAENTWPQEYVIDYVRVWERQTKERFVHGA